MSVFSDKERAFQKAVLASAFVIGAPVFFLQWILLAKILAGSFDPSSLLDWIDSSDGGEWILMLTVGLPALAAYGAAKLFMVAWAKRRQRDDDVE